MAGDNALPFRAAADGETVSGKFTGTVQLSSGKFAVVERAHEFTLVSWWPVIDRQLGREVMGVVRGGSGVVAVGTTKRAWSIISKGGFAAIELCLMWP